MEENRRFSWTDLFIKIILVAIFVLFTVWLLSLSTKGLSNSLDVLTDNIFSQNMEKMKEVGKEYFTLERLPEKVGDIKTLTLKEMYEKKLILSLNDKNGNACSAENSYVSIERYDNEYQMKVYLECGEEKDHIIVIMGCYDYCDTDICEFDKEQVKDIEYQYKKTTGGKWTDYGKWSEWSKVAVSKTNYRQVETKVVKENYTYDKVITETIFANPNVCPSTYNGYTLVSQDGFTCNYSKTITTTVEPYACPKTYDGYTLVNQDGFTCNYSKTIATTAAPKACPSTYGDGYILVSQNGFTCNYGKTTTSTTEYTKEYLYTYNFSYRPSSDSTYYYEVIDVKYGYACDTTCSATTTYVVNVYKKVYKTETITDTKTSTVGCPTGYIKSGNSCIKNTIDTTTGTVYCPTGYTKSGNSCVKNEVSTKNTEVSCPLGYTKTSDNTKCYKDVEKTEKVTETRDVTYYRYRIREYIGGTTDYKWSTSKNDKKLLDAGYKLTGKTR